MAIDIGDAVLRFMADTTDLENMSKAEASVSAAAKRMGQAASQGAAGFDDLGRAAGAAEAKLRNVAGAPLPLDANDAAKVRAQGKQLVADLEANKTRVEQMARSLGITTAASLRSQWHSSIELLEGLKAMAAPAVDIDAAAAKEREIFGNLQKHLRGTQDAAQATGARLGEMFWSMFGGQMAFDLVMRGLRGIKELFKDSIMESLAFERSFRDVEVALAGSGVNADRYRQQLHGVSTELGRASDLAKGLAIALRSTDKDPAAVQMVTASGRLAATYGLDLGATVATVSDILATYGVGAEQAADYTNMLGVAFSKSDDFGQAFLERIGKFLPLMQSLGVPLNDVLAIVTALTSKGLSAGEALAGLGQIFLAATKPSKEMSEALYGIQAAGGQVNVTLGKEGVAAAGGFLPWLERLADSIRGNDQAMATFGGGIRRASAVFALFGQDIAGVNKLSTEFADKLGVARTAAEQFDAKMQDVSLQAKRTWIVWTEGIAQIIGSTRELSQAWRDVNNTLELSFKLWRTGADIPGLLAAAIIGKYTMPAAAPVPAVPGKPKTTAGNTTGPQYVGPSVEQAQFAQEITAQLDKQTGILEKYRKIEFDVNEKLAGQEDLRKRILELVKKKRAEELADIGKEDRERERRLAEQQAQQAAQARERLYSIAGLSNFKPLGELKQSEAAARMIYQQKLLNEAPIYEQVQAYDAWRRKILELNDALMLSGRRAVEFPDLINKNLTTQQEKLKEIIAANKAGGKVEMITAPVKGLDGFLDGADKLKVQMALLKVAFEGLGLISREESVQMSATAEDWYKRTKWAYERGLATHEQVLAAEIAFLETRVRAWQEGNAAITQAELDRLEKLKQQQKDSKAPYQFDQNSPMTSLLTAWKKKKGEADKELTATEKLFGEFGDAMAGAIGTGLAAWISGSGSFADALKSCLAQLAQYWMVRSIGELAEGFAMLFLNPVDAAMHFKSAALFGAAATAAGLASRAIPSSNGQQQGASDTGQEYQRKTPEPVKGTMAGAQSGMGAFASDLVTSQAAINSRLAGMAYSARMASVEASGMIAGAPVNITIHAVDAASFQDLCKRNPQAVVSVVENDILGNGRLRRATAARTPV